MSCLPLNQTRSTKGCHTVFSERSAIFVFCLAGTTTHCLHTSLPHSRQNTPVFLIMWVPWHTTAIKLSVKARWLVANLGKPPGSQRILPVTLVVDLQEDERRRHRRRLWIAACIHTPLPASSASVAICQLLF